MNVYIYTMGPFKFMSSFQKIRKPRYIYVKFSKKYERPDKFMSSFQKMTRPR